MIKSSDIIPGCLVLPNICATWRDLASAQKKSIFGFLSARSGILILFKAGRTSGPLGTSVVQPRRLPWRRARMLCTTPPLRLHHPFRCYRLCGSWPKDTRTALRRSRSSSCACWRRSSGSCAAPRNRTPRMMQQVSSLTQPRAQRSHQLIAGGVPTRRTGGCHRRRLRSRYIRFMRTASTRLALTRHRHQPYACPRPVHPAQHGGKPPAGQLAMQQPLATRAFATRRQAPRPGAHASLLQGESRVARHRERRRPAEHR